jgi:hypothetical protein
MGGGRVTYRVFLGSSATRCEYSYFSSLAVVLTDLADPAGLGTEASLGVPPQFHADAGRY